MRLFFALWPPPWAAEQLAALATASARKFGGRATRPETLHMTLAFLGEVGAERLPLLVATARTVKARRFVLSVDGLYYWSDKQLLWAGCSSPPPALGELSDALRDALGRAGYAYDGQNRTLTPHLTLVRKIPKTSEPIEHAATTRIAWRCDGFSLVCSRPSGGGSLYETIAVFPGADRESSPIGPLNGIPRNQR